jgi:hypothetical protein
MSGKSNVRFWLTQHDIEPADDVVDAVFDHAKKAQHILTDEEIFALIKKS